MASQKVELGAAHGILLPAGQLPGALGHASGVDHDAFGGVDDGLVEVDLVQILGIGVVELGQMGLGLVLDVQHALFHQDDVVSRIGVAAAVEGVVGAVGDKGLAGEGPHAGFAVLGLAVLVYGLAGPVGKDFVLQDLLVLFRDEEGILGAVGDGVELVSEPAPGDVRREGASPGGAVGSADDELVVLDDQGRRLAAAPEGLGA